MTVRRPSWKRKRWIAAIVLLLLLAYPATLGPANYALVRRWLPPGPFFKVYQPLMSMMDEEHGLLRRYATWWAELGMRHETPPPEHRPAPLPITE